MKKKSVFIVACWVLAVVFCAAAIESDNIRAAKEVLLRA